MKKNLLNIACLIMAVCALSGCIENDLPYPRIPAQILSIEAEGMSQAPVIDNATQTVVLTMNETVNLKQVNITQATITENAVATPAIVGVHDLSTAAEFTLSLYQDYKWKISAVQNITRNIAVEGQVGNAIIDAEN